MSSSPRLPSTATSENSFPTVANGDPLLEALARSQALGFLGPKRSDTHIDHALGFASAWEDVARGEPFPRLILDLGSGGGVPGLVLARSWRQARLTLLDASERRTAFLTQVIDHMALSDRIEVVRSR